MARILLSALSARSGGARIYLENILRFFPADADHTLDVISVVQPAISLQRTNINWIQAPSWTLNPALRIAVGFIRPLFSKINLLNYDAVFFVGGTPDLPVGPQQKIIVTFHNANLLNNAYRLYGWGWDRLRHWLLRWASLRLFARADLVICISQYGQTLVDANVPLRTGRLVVIPHGVDVTTEALSEEFERHLPDDFVLYVSPFYATKGHIELIEAWALTKKLHPSKTKLVLAGSEDYAPYVRRVRRMIAQHKIENDVIFLGSVPHSQISALLNRATLSVFPSLSENCPVTLLEIMRAGSPLISSSREPMPEFGGPNLDYVDPANTAGFADLILKFLSDPKLRADRANLLRARSLRFNWADAGNQTWSEIIGCCESDRRLT